MFVIINAALVKNFDVFCTVAITGKKNGNWKWDLLPVDGNGFCKCPDISNQNTPVLSGEREGTRCSCSTITNCSMWWKSLIMRRMAGP